MVLKFESYKKIVLALDFLQSDQYILSHAVHMSTFNTEVVLLHIVESAGAAIYHTEINDEEIYIDSKMLENYENFLRDLGYKFITLKSTSEGLRLLCLN